MNQTHTKKNDDKNYDLFNCLNIQNIQEATNIVKFIVYIDACTCFSSTQIKFMFT